MSERLSVALFEETLYLMNHIETDAEHYAKFHREIVVAFSALRASEAALAEKCKRLEAALREIADTVKKRNPDLPLVEDAMNGCRYAEHIARRALEARDER